MINQSTTEATAIALSEPPPLRKSFEIAPHPQALAFWKRGFDLIVSTVALLLLFPIVLMVAIAVKLASKGPVLYKSTRIGLGGKSIQMYKFRSMYIDADERLKELWDQNDHDGPCFKIKHDPRITPIGGFLRRYSLDELPQFINVWLGEMSLVGPRALHKYEVEKFDDFAMRRLTVKPGITCYWQIMGRSDLTFQEWMELDNRYIDEFGFTTDLKILLKTPAAVVRGSGAY